MQNPMKANGGVSDCGIGMPNGNIVLHSHIQSFGEDFLFWVEVCVRGVEFLHHGCDVSNKRMSFVID